MHLLLGPGGEVHTAEEGPQYILAIIRELVGFRPASQGTKLSEPLRFLTNVNKKRCTTFLLSDFLEPDADREAFDHALKIASGRHDLVAVRVTDPREAELPDAGIVELQDAGERPPGVGRYLLARRACALRRGVAQPFGAGSCACCRSTASTRPRWPPTAIMWWNS